MSSCHRFRLPLALMALIAAGGVVAQEVKPLRVVVGGSASHDSNVFRLPESVDPQAIGRPGRSDTVRSGYVGLRLDKPYSLQRFQIDVTKTAYRHDNFDQLDFDALDYRGAWLWHLTPWTSGVLSADRTETLVPFSDFEGTQRNIRTSESRSFSLDSRLRGSWHLLLGASRHKQRSSLPVRTDADFESSRGELGARYRAASGSSLGFLQRIHEGDYVNRTVVAGSIDNSFTEDQSELQASWILTGRSLLNARATRLDRRHPNVPARDFAAWTGNLTYAWTATGKLRLNLTAQRDISASLDPLAAYTQRDTLAVTPVWQASAKITARTRLGRTDTDHGNASPTSPARRDETTLADLSIDWTVSNNIVLTASVLREERSSNLPGFDYRATVTRVGASLTF